ncbi:hypothetical protein CH306_26015 [Rhodococcus sp. 15-725-2-2b]|nr:hypothetical protein CH277_22645 [Rhodococcus sp. 06-469-3-2]OZD40808.1 hypothetical protein CH264_24330 [Rhodococcus sp. 06-1477-1A]OZE67084.1 hypothetical protein CH306_26015 [Rhodococcus sp. 15-725-2-2b]
MRLANVRRIPSLMRVRPIQYSGRLPKLRAFTGASLPRSGMSSDARIQRTAFFEVRGRAIE